MIDDQHFGITLLLFQLKAELRLDSVYERGPIRIEAISPRSVALYQTEAPDSTVTSPIRHAVGAIHASGATVGRFPRYG